MTDEKELNDQCATPEKEVGVSVNRAERGDPPTVGSGGTSMETPNPSGESGALCRWEIDKNDNVMAALFGSHLSLFIHEGEMIWQRHIVMLLANTVILGVALSRFYPSPVETTIASVVGAGLCLVWFKVAKLGNRNQDIFQKAASRFTWKGLGNTNDPANPLAFSELHRQDRRWGSVRRTADYVLWPFLLGYILLFAGASVQLLKRILCASN